MRTTFSLVAAMLLCGPVFAEVETSPGNYGASVNQWVQPTSNADVDYGPKGFSAALRAFFNSSNPTPQNGAEVGFSDQIVRVSSPREGNTRTIAIDLEVEALFFTSVPRLGGATPGPLSITLTGPGGLFPLEGGSTNAPINYTSSEVILSASTVGETKLEYSRHYELEMAAGLNTFFYMRPALIVAPFLDEGDVPHLDFFYMELTYTVAYSIVPAPGVGAAFAAFGLIGAARRRR